ncbi:MAG: PP2C family protein-serine/threonine phosphatase [Kiritimatiellia bacterium]
MMDWLKDLLGASPHGTVTFRAAGMSDVGLVRKENQDRYFCHPETGVFCVADGMGGGQEGARASQWTVEALDAVEASCADTYQARATAALQAANDRIRQYAAERGFRMMGTTVAVFRVDPKAPASGLVGHAGDTRIYRLRARRLDPLTTDHTVGSELGRACSSFDGMESRTLKSRQNPLTHVLTRAVGTQLRVNPEWRRVNVCRGDRYLLCSDGVHDMLSDADLCALMSSARNPEGVVENISRAVRAAGAGDNYTIVCAFAG